MMDEVKYSKAAVLGADRRQERTTFKGGKLADQDHYAGTGAGRPHLLGARM
jgi:hypothetical protein